MGFAVKIGVSILSWLNSVNTGAEFILVRVRLAEVDRDLLTFLLSLQEL